MKFSKKNENVTTNNIIRDGLVVGSFSRSNASATEFDVLTLAIVVILGIIARELLTKSIVIPSIVWLLFEILLILLIALIAASVISAIIVIVTLKKEKKDTEAL